MDEAAHLKRAIDALEAQRSILGDAVVDAGIAPLLEKLEALEHTPVEERRMVTILFADVSGFTAMAEKKDPEHVREAINALWARLDAVILGYGGTIDKHIGDAVMALFGAPRAREDDAVRAVRAALDMQAAMRDEERLGIRIGVHTGPVIVGHVGSRAEYTALGDAVNVASRLESAAPVGQVLISRETYRLVEGVFDVTEQPPLQLKGKSEPLVAYLVGGLRTERKQRWRGVQGVRTRMVGRDKELAQLQENFLHTREDRRATLALVAGDAGVGKSRLIWAFQDWIAERREPTRIFRARVTEEARHVPYSLFRDLFLFQFKIQESDPRELARRKLMAGFEAFPTLTEEQAHFIGYLIGLDMSDSPYLSGILDDTVQLRDRSFAAVASFFEAAAQPRQETVDAEVAVVLRLEDLHWADDGSIQLVAHILRACAHVPMSVVGTTRPSLLDEGKAPILDPTLLIWLRPLPAEDTKALVAEILQHASTIPDELTDRLVGTAGGNPFFLEEIVNSLIEEGTIDASGDEWTVADIDDVRVPSSLAALLQTRLDRLDEEERELLQHASVVGRRFWDDALAAMVSIPLERIGGILQQLCHRELLLPVETSTFEGSHEYAFRHSLLRDTVYESLLLRLRPTAHSRVAQWLTQRSGGATGAWSGRIAHHWERAGERLSAGRWYMRSARQASKMYALGDAIDHSRKALDMLPKSRSERARRLDAFESLARSLRLQTRFEEATAAFEQMREEAEEVGDRRAQVQAWLGLAMVLNNGRNTTAALEATSRAVNLATEMGDAELLVSALVMKGYCHYMLSESGEAVAAAEDALAACTPNDLVGKARATRLVANAYRLRGEYGRAVRAGEEALEMWRDLGDTMSLRRMLNELGEAARLSGDYLKAAKLYEEALKNGGPVMGRLTTLINIAGTQVMLGNPTSALQCLNEVFDEAPPDWVNLGEAYAYHAEASAMVGDCETALESARKAVEISPRQFVGIALRVLGSVTALSMNGLCEEALQSFQRSEQLLSESKMEAERARTLRAWAEAEIQFGDDTSGRDRLAEAEAVFDALGLSFEVERIRQRPQEQPA